MVRAHVGPHFNIDSFFIIEIFLNFNDSGEKFTLSSVEVSPCNVQSLSKYGTTFFKMLIKSLNKTI